MERVAVKLCIQSLFSISLSRGYVRMFFVSTLKDKERIGTRDRNDTLLSIHSDSSRKGAGA